MLKHVTIENFRLFKHFTINDLARVNLVVGENNVGKSSLLEALHLLVNQDSPDALLSLLEARGEFSIPTDSNRSNRYARYDISHLFFGHEPENGNLPIRIQSNGMNPVGLKLTYHKPTEQLTFFAEEDPSRLIESAFLRLEYSANKKDFRLDLLGKLLEERRRFSVYNRVSVPLVKAHYVTTKSFDYEYLAELWDEITLTPNEAGVTKMLQILDPRIERISFQSRKTSNSGILLKFKGQDRPLPLGSMGDGMHRILAIAIALANSENGYLFVDEIDTGLHYRTITDMWNLVLQTAARLNIQVFATTHSSDCIRSFSEALDIQDSDLEIGKLFRLERLGEQIESVAYTRDDLNIATQTMALEVR